MDRFPHKLRMLLEKRRDENSLRTLSPPSAGIDFSSNDYLGFSGLAYPAEKEGQEASGSTGSRLIRGNHAGYPPTEAAVAEFHRAECALIYTSGYDANLGLLSSVARRTDYVFYDSGVHASIRDGIRLSPARSHSFEHNRIAALEMRFQKAFAGGRPEGSEVYVVTESVFSMEGDCADLGPLLAFCKANKCRLILDEAHAVGVLGPGGRGLASALGVEADIFARVVTFGKALGSHGAAVLGDRELVDYLVNFSRSLIYTTALPPGSLRQIREAYAFLRSPEGGGRLRLLREKIEAFETTLTDLGLKDWFSGGDSAIFSCLVGGNTPTRALAAELAERGFDVRPILSPTVPAGRECLRFCLHSFNTLSEIQGVLRILETLLKVKENE